jgi:predicted MPP superfamily phosphohydrolase
MISQMPFSALRLTILTLAVLSQIYLFVRIRQFIRSLGRSERFKAQAIGLVGAVIGLLFALNGYILFRPIPWVDPPLSAQLSLFYPPTVWTLGSLFSAFFLFLIRTVGGLGRMMARLYRLLTGQAASTPVNLSRRHFLQAGAGGMATVPLLLSGYGAVYLGHTYEIRELTLPFGHPLRVIQLSDIHAGIFMNRKEIRRYTDLVISLQPDLFVLTGDFISNSLSFLPGCLEEMSRVRTRYGTLATLGNHEYWYGNLEELQRIFRQQHIPLLNNAHQKIRTEQGLFAVAGIDDLRTGHPDLKTALEGLDSSIPTLLLSHRPEIFPQAAGCGIPLTLAGHYHGGQIKLMMPGMVISLAHFRTVYPEGLYQINTSRLYVNRGIGTTFTPVRLNVPPEITLLNLT